jgi:hypothetical protein
MEVSIVSANDKQVGGEHYQQPIQAWDYITLNRLGYLEGNIIKYVTRYKHKHGLQDLEKARHYLDKLIEVNQPQLQDKPCTNCISPASCEFNDRCQKGLSK